MSKNDFCKIFSIKGYNKLKAIDMNFRVPGEFEQQESVILIWPPTSYATSTNEFDRDKVCVEIVKNLLGHVRVIITCYREELKSHVINRLNQENIDTSKVEFMIYPYLNIYARDFGAQVVVDSVGNKAFVDFAFNCYGYLPQGHPMSRNLEAFDKAHANYLGIQDAFFTRLISEGGDHEFNGKGIMMTIEDTEVNKRNSGWLKEEVEAEFKKLFNLEKIIWIPRATYDDEHMFAGPIPDENNQYTAYRSGSANGHIDEMCRFVNEDTILIAHITDEEAESSELHRLNKERLDEALKVLESATTLDGKPFNIIKMPTPEPVYININPDDDVYEALTLGSEFLEGKMLDGSTFPTGSVKALPALSYCNFLIANDIVLAQKYYRLGMSEKVKERDELALHVLQNAFPEKTVIAIDTLALNLYGGGIHCNTRNVPSTRGHGTSPSS